MRWIVCVMLASVGVNLSGAGPFLCAHCRCDKPCQKTSRLVCEEKDVEVTCWGYQCEDFALPGPSKPGCEHCDTVCDFCGDEGQPDAAKKKGEYPIHSQPQPFVWRDWIPNPHAKVFTKKKLMKKVVKQKVPTYKWVVEDLCAACAEQAPKIAPPADAKVPAPPAGATILAPKTARPPEAPGSSLWW